jgi:hypothetical protein
MRIGIDVALRSRGAWSAITEATAIRTAMRVGAMVKPGDPPENEARLRDAENGDEDERCGEETNWVPDPK